jgi:hypothetical protein
MLPRRSMRVLKANSRKRPGEIFSQLAQGLHAIAETFRELGEAME